MGEMIDKMLGKSDEQKEEKKEDKQIKLMKDQQLVDVATANEPFDYRQQEARSDLLKWQQDLDDEVEKLKHRLRSEEKKKNGSWGTKIFPVGVNKETNETIYNQIPPLANELFIDYIQSQVEPFMSRNLFSSNLNEKRILRMLMDTCNDIADAMADGWDIYEIEFINYDLVMRLIKNVITPGPFRALNDGQRRHDRTIAKRVEAFNEREPSKDRKKGLMGASI